MNAVKKLSKFNRVAKTNSQYDVITNNLDRLLTLSQQGVANVCKFFHENQLSDCLIITDEEQKSIQALKSKIKDNEIFAHARNVDNLPIHLDDDRWLAKYIAEELKLLAPDSNLSVDKVLKYVKTAPEFQQARLDFEARLTKALIIDANLEKTDETNVGTKRACLYEYDEVFRNKIIGYLQVLGGDAYQAELSLESNANLWRQQSMVRAFDEFFYPQYAMPQDEQSYAECCAFREKHRARWLKYREFTYFGNHADVVREAGTVTDNMCISQLEYFNTVKKLNEYNQTRRKLMENNEPINKRQKKKTQVIVEPKFMEINVKDFL